MLYQSLQIHGTNIVDTESSFIDTDTIDIIDTDIEIKIGLNRMTMINI